MCLPSCPLFFLPLSPPHFQISHVCTGAVYVTAVLSPLCESPLSVSLFLASPWLVSLLSTPSLNTSPIFAFQLFTFQLFALPVFLLSLFPSSLFTSPLLASQWFALPMFLWPSFVPLLFSLQNFSCLLCASPLFVSMLLASPYSALPLFVQLLFRLSCCLPSCCVLHPIAAGLLLHKMLRGDQTLRNCDGDQTKKKLRLGPKNNIMETWIKSSNSTSLIGSLRTTCGSVSRQWALSPSYILSSNYE